MEWLLLTFGSAITGSLTKILQKILLKNEQTDAFAFGFVFQLTVAALFLIYSIVANALEFPNLLDMLPNLAVMTIFYSLGNALTFLAFKKADASEVAIIFASNSIWTVVSAVVLLNEQVTIVHGIGILLIMAGVAAINYTKTAWKFNLGHLYAVLAAMLFGIAFTNDAYIINRYQSISSYMVIAFAFPGFATAVYSPRLVTKLKNFISIRTFSKLMLCGLLYAVSAMAIFTAYKLGGKASIISPLQQSSIIFTVLFSYVLLNEKKRLFQKVVGTACVFGGTLLLI